MTQQLAGRVAVQRGAGNADADRRRHLPPFGIDRLGEHADEAVGDDCGATHVEPGQHDHELVATHATGDGSGFEAARQPIGDDADEAIASAVAECVVDRFEAVEVAEQQAHRVLLVGGGQDLIEQLQRAAPVVQPCQRIVRGLMGEPLVGRGKLVVHAGELAALVRQIA